MWLDIIADEWVWSHGFYSESGTSIIPKVLNKVGYSTGSKGNSYTFQKG